MAENSNITRNDVDTSTSSSFIFEHKSDTDVQLIYLFSMADSADPGKSGC